GKTTLLSVIAGTLGVDRGEVEVFDSPLHNLDKRAVTQFRAANIGFIFQQYNLIPTLNCIENVSVPLRIQGQKAAVAEKKAAELLETVGLGNRMRHRPNMLSGGQQQRVAIARALVHEPMWMNKTPPDCNPAKPRPPTSRVIRQSRLNCALSASSLTSWRRPRSFRRSNSPVGRVLPAPILV